MGPRFKSHFERGGFKAMDSTVFKHDIEKFNTSPVIDFRFT